MILNEFSKPCLAACQYRKSQTSKKFEEILKKNSQLPIAKSFIEVLDNRAVARKFFVMGEVKDLQSFH